MKRGREKLVGIENLSIAGISNIEYLGQTKRKRKRKTKTKRMKMKMKREFEVVRIT